MTKYHVAAALLALTSAPVFAQEEEVKPITVSGSVSLVTDYRYRGVSQSDEKMAIQGGLTVTHETGLYAGAWASNLAGWGTFGGSNMELDLFGGIKKTFGGATVDVGLTWYMYPGGANTTDFAEPYVKVSSTFGPVTGLVGVAYAPKQKALGNWSNTPQSAVGSSHDNLYLWGDLSGGIPGTPVTLKGHLGYSKGNPGLGPNGTSVAPTGKYWDWLVGADVVVGPVVLGVAYVDTSITNADRQYLLLNFGNSQDGSDIAGGRVIASITASF
ncbi:MAG: TorF family putative porin [Sphingomonadales bacterium]